MNPTHKKMIDGILQKANRLCPDALDAIGVYGSEATGDTHDKSDLDLLILVNDPSGYLLSEAFLLTDTGIGYDLYCTTWERLEQDATCTHAHLSKLLDSQLVYVKDDAVVQRLTALRQQANAVLSSPDRIAKVHDALAEAKKAYADCFLADSLSQVRLHAGGVIHLLTTALMLYHGTYFRKGVKRTFSELAALALPFDMEALVMAVISPCSADEIRQRLTDLLKTVQAYLSAGKEKEAPNENNLQDTYEEMFSNWRNKMWEAAQNNDVFASFINMVSCQCMLQDIADTVAIQKPDLLADFDPCHTQKNAEVFDEALRRYLENYRQAGMQPRQFANIDAFLAAYLQQEN